MCPRARYKWRSSRARTSFTRRGAKLLDKLIKLTINLTVLLALGVVYGIKEGRGGESVIYHAAQCNSARRRFFRYSYEFARQKILSALLARERALITTFRGV